MTTQPALAELWCGEHAHRLGRVYESGGRRVLSLVASTMLAREIDPDTSHPTEQVGYSAAVHDLDSDVKTVRRCRCGTWLVAVATVCAKVDAGERIIYAARSWPRRGAVQDSA